MSSIESSFLTDFPGHHHTIRHLKMNDRHFQQLLNQYSEINHEIYLIEADEITTSDEYLETQKKKRLVLKDELFQLVKKEEDSQTI